tara:strand:- start:325 stop:576 length:252 start_codon:yes stop_codon:yes gene_type:complete
MKKNESLGHSATKKFGIGDLVTWKDLSGPQKLGIIKEIYTKMQGGRPVAYARVFLVKDDKKQSLLHEEDIIIIKLRLVSKRSR